MTACELCKGSCCKSVVLPLSPYSERTHEWFALHGEVKSGMVRLNQPCSKLIDGKCSIYETRPEVCRTFPVGCSHCLEDVKLFAEDKDKVMEAINASRT
jgi:Fe-S-cluster containining protein